LIRKLHGRLAKDGTEDEALIAVPENVMPPTGLTVSRKFPMLHFQAGMIRANTGLAQRSRPASAHPALAVRNNLLTTLPASRFAAD